MFPELPIAGDPSEKSSNPFKASPSRPGVNSREEVPMWNSGATRRGCELKGAPQSAAVRSVGGGHSMCSSPSSIL